MEVDGGNKRKRSTIDDVQDAGFLCQHSQCGISFSSYFAMERHMTTTFHGRCLWKGGVCSVSTTSTHFRGKMPVGGSIPLGMCECCYHQCSRPRDLKRHYEDVHIHITKVDTTTTDQQQTMSVTEISLEKAVKRRLKQEMRENGVDPESRKKILETFHLKAFTKYKQNKESTKELDDFRTKYEVKTLWQPVNGKDVPVGVCMSIGLVYLDLLEMLNITKTKAKTDRQKLKMALDSAQVAGNGRNILTFTLEIVSRLGSIVDCKSPSNNKPIVIYLGKEDTEEFFKTMKPMIDTIKRLLVDNIISVGGTDYPVELLLCNDYYCAAQLFGLIDVYAPTSYWLCMWCYCNRNEVNDFSHECRHQLRRDDNKPNLLALAPPPSAAMTKKPGFEQYGQGGQVHIPCETSRKIPCSLHLKIGTTKQMTKKTVCRTMSEMFRKLTALRKERKREKAGYASSLMKRQATKKKCRKASGTIEKKIGDLLEECESRIAKRTDQQVKMHLETLRAAAAEAEEPKDQHQQLQALFTEMGDQRVVGVTKAMIDKLEGVSVAINLVAAQQQKINDDDTTTYDENDAKVKELNARIKELQDTLGDDKQREKERVVRLLSFLKKKKVTIYKSKVIDDDTVETIVEKISFTYSDCMIIINNRAEFIDCLTDDATLKKELSELWEVYAYLVWAIERSEEVYVTDQKWLTISKVFAEKYRLLFPQATITSYMHCFVFHVGQFTGLLKMSLDRMANFGIECRHKIVKLLVKRSNHHWDDVLFGKLLMKCYHWYDKQGKDTRSQDESDATQHLLTKRHKWATSIVERKPSPKLIEKKHLFYKKR
ncbi:hypothetical protein SAMD00019534_092990 [Acytostelium subglobosum LB1]|uniref:hypothetical protein n=1 Tax=Acytostelium subglobosum LB1 TaxID=1410327 RepID=UPI0006451A6F|nr:hypothetical protein SAMD00019534_092990 [Acytostelium subglobosum LB1]GAM26124.1 hypothetical protein SAMD00019534_092990 [Acytostelium subglobosum LB1]|eukprot:XP_012751167.1 hypothetical protein SAMD00019534_092990 [Acytostelium subglobosum LB1]